MNLDEKQKQEVAAWLQEGVSLAEVQKKLESEFGVTLTYMEVKFLVADLDLTPIDPEPEKKDEPEPPDAPASDPSKVDDSHVPSDEGDVEDTDVPAEDLEPEPAGLGSVSVEVDQLARPGAMISGKVTFANGKTSEWMLDQMGRLGVVPAEDGYKPTQTDLAQFQSALQDELKKMGL